MPTPSPVTVRPYRAEDRQAIREICWQTAFMGQPMDFMYTDRESWVDLFTRYYTDREPEGCFVAENASGEVIGYLLGASDTRKLIFSYAQVALRHLLLRGVLLRPGSARFWWRLAWDVLTDRVRKPTYEHHRYPAEMHINLLAEGRASGAARDLVMAWYAHLRSQGVRGGWGSVLADNERSLRFLEKCGYSRVGEPYLVPGMRRPDGGRLHAQHVLFDVPPLNDCSHNASNRPATQAVTSGGN